MVNQDIKLGFELCEVLNSYYIEDLIEFLKGKTASCLYFDKLKPLYDKYGYKTVNNCLMVLYKEKKKEEIKEEQTNE